MAATCEFSGRQLQESLRDQFICGLSTERTQRKLLSQKYTFQQALDTALAEEAAAKDVCDMMVNSAGGRTDSAINN